MPSQSSTMPVIPGVDSATSRTRSSRASEVAKKSPIESEDHDAGHLLVGRMLVELALHLRTPLAAEEGHRRSGGHRDEP